MALFSFLVSHIASVYSLLLFGFSFSLNLRPSFILFSFTLLFDFFLLFFIHPLVFCLFVRLFLSFIFIFISHMCTRCKINIINKGNRDDNTENEGGRGDENKSEIVNKKTMMIKERETKMRRGKEGK